MATVNTPEAKSPPTRSYSRVGPADPWFHWIFLALSSVILLLSVLLTLSEGQPRVTIPGFEQPLPPFCSMQRMFGIDCPGCGMTRSFVSLAHGQWREALQFNPAGPLLFAVIAFQIPYRVLQLRRLQRGQPELQWSRLGYFSMTCIMLAMLLQWSLRMFAGVSFASSW
jgi:hypothetical protein